MRGYDREEPHPELEEEYEDYDDGDGYEQHEEDREEYEEEEEEDPRPSKEALEYLELRQRLKEQIRKKNKKGGGSALNNSNDRKRKLPYDNYGSFFGPSQPVISQRVIQESKSLLETQHLTPKVSNPSHPNKKSTNSSTSGSRRPEVHSKKSKVVNEVRSKVLKLKQTRDYSFLLSDNAELPASSKAAPQKNMPVSSYEARPAHVPVKSTQGSGNGVRHVNGSLGERKPVPTNGHMHSKTGPTKLPSTTSRPNSTPMDSRRPHSSSNGTGPGRPLGPKAVPSKVPAPVEKKAHASVARSSVSNMRPPPSKSQPPSRSQLPTKSQPSSKAQLPSKSQPPSKLQLSSKSQTSISRQQMEHRRELQGLNKPKMVPKQQAGLSRPQTNKPLKQNSSYHRSPDNRPKKKPVRPYSDDEDDGNAAISMIRQMFRYNPNKFADRDDDLSDMEANFDDIMREENYSAKVARREDEEQLRLIQEEEKRERLAKLKKQRRH